MRLRLKSGKENIKAPPRAGSSGGFPSQGASDAENGSILWRLHEGGYIIWISQAIMYVAYDGKHNSRMLVNKVIRKSRWHMAA